MPFVENPIKDANGTVIGYTLVHSEHSEGPNIDQIDLTNPKDYYVKNYLALNGSNIKYYAWDTPDLPKTLPSTTFIGTPGPSSQPSLIEMMKDSQAPIIRDAGRILSSFFEN
jgi:hypothetical protein